MLSGGDTEGLGSYLLCSWNPLSLFAGLERMQRGRLRSPGGGPSLPRGSFLAGCLLQDLGKPHPPSCPLGGKDPACVSLAARPLLMSSSATAVLPDAGHRVICWLTGRHRHAERSVCLE